MRLRGTTLPMFTSDSGHLGFHVMDSGWRGPAGWTWGTSKPHIGRYPSLGFWRSLGFGHLDEIHHARSMPPLRMSDWWIPHWLVAALAVVLPTWWTWRRLQTLSEARLTDWNPRQVRDRRASWPSQNKCAWFDPQARRYPTGSCPPDRVRASSRGRDRLRPGCPDRRRRRCARSGLGFPSPGFRPDCGLCAALACACGRSPCTRSPPAQQANGTEQNRRQS